MGKGQSKAAGNPKDSSKKYQDEEEKSGGKDETHGKETPNENGGGFSEAIGVHQNIPENKDDDKGGDDGDGEEVIKPT